ncbi:GDS1 [Candida pseudojiufengensis]|uniref:GDS1 n=1 Tax=Candida pseudojiufengensis TaxID=497109 RepID=UPI00222510D8|nr:GDS1 [Candida pseudojiufengensis]KAI5964197.1 GDS1 [Candida pseudojiufengensis]
MALADRRPMALPTTASPISPSFNPNTLGVSSKSRNNSLPLKPTEEENLDETEQTEQADVDLEEATENRNEANEEEEDEDEDDKQSISSELEKMEIQNENDLENSSTSRSASPDSILDKNKSATRESTPPTTISTPPSSQGDTGNGSTSKDKKEKVKKPKPISRAPIATGISTAIPVTGEKPKPEQKGDASLEDDVLFAIFVILYERDPEGQGFTVKQICDILVEEHPSIAQLSTKTSNLVSAKLNAYVKRVEKGDTSLKYAISRDWADASPKRMVYVYRGILAPGFEIVAKKLMDEIKQQRGEEQAQLQAEAEAQADSQLDGKSNDEKSSVATSPKSSSKKILKDLPLSNSLTDDSLELGKQASLAKPRRQTMYDLGITKHSFFETGGPGFDKSNLFVPYSSAPVTAALNEVSTTDSFKDPLDMELDDEEFEGVFADSDQDEDIDDSNLIETIRKNGKRSKSMSYLSMTKKTKVLTAAAAAPRASRAPSSHSPNAAAAAAALHAAALRAISRSTPTSKDTDTNKKWLNVIRSGFLSQDIGTPEDTKLSDLDKFFA